MHRYLERSSSPRRQRGVAMILVVVGMVALLLMVGLALDGGHTMLNKTRIQNTVDAAALAAAKTLDETGDTAQATAAALGNFGGNANAAGNAEMQTAYGGGSGDIQVTVQYSETLQPFTPGAPSGPYVRVIATDFTMPAWFVTLAGITEKEVAASAVAGPSPVIDNACNIAPMMVCGDPTPPPGTLWGYELNTPDVLKTAASGGWEGTPGPGNFQLIRLGGGQGAAELRQNMAGSYGACLGSGEVIETEPGNAVGPVAQGLNTRFGQYAGPMHGTQSQYPPDVVVTGQAPSLTAAENAVTGEDDIYQGSEHITTDDVNDPNSPLYTYQEYVADTQAQNYDYQPISDGGTGEFERRVVAVPVGDCSTTTNGQGEVPLLGFACFFLLQPASQQGNEAHVFGQFIEGCQINGTPGPNPGTGPSPYIIQLYDDPDNPDA